MTLSDERLAEMRRLGDEVDVVSARLLAEAIREVDRLRRAMDDSDAAIIAENRDLRRELRAARDEVDRLREELRETQAVLKDELDNWNPERRPTITAERDKALAQVKTLREALGRAAFVAEHLFQMIDRDTWRASGGDDGQGHYEGDYRAEKTRDEIATWVALTASPEVKGLSVTSRQRATPEAGEGGKG